MCCGYDSETPVSELHRAPFRFTGQIDRVIVSISGQPFSHVAKEVKNEFIAQQAPDGPAPGPDSPPRMTQSISASSSTGSGPSSGSHATLAPNDSLW